MQCGGGHLFAAVEHGAGRGFGVDVREHWIVQARFLAEHVPGAGLEFAVEDVRALPALGMEPFDLTVFNGIFYHLPDPMASLRAAADLTRELLVLNTAYVPGTVDALLLAPESETDVMSGVHGLAWMPGSENVLRQILAWCGFPHTRVTFRRHSPGSTRHRIKLLAAREERTFAHFGTVFPSAGDPPRDPWRRRLRRRVARLAG